tara:strand:+ start:817 stop:1059 length:243 start_codon:yes stop_codon:yes gene_type:complete
MGDAYDDYEQRMLWRHIKNDFHQPERRVNYRWTMRDGSKILIKDMTDSHLQNCINLVSRRDGQCESLDILKDEMKRRTTR